jgi:hypothetical protein
MANLHLGHHVVHVSRSIAELGLIAAIWAIAAVSTATLICERLFA